MGQMKTKRRRSPPQASQLCYTMRSKIKVALQHEKKFVAALVTM
jgi:hypothetical protein